MANKCGKDAQPCSFLKMLFRIFLPLHLVSFLMKEIKANNSEILCLPVRLTKMLLGSWRRESIHFPTLLLGYKPCIFSRKPSGNNYEVKNVPSNLVAVKLS